MKQSIAGMAVALCAALPVAPAALAQHSHSGTAMHHDAAGEPGDPKQPARVVNVVMREDGAKMLFIPDRIAVRAGEQVRFVLRNIGDQDHEFFIGTEAEVKEHVREMKAMPGMQHVEPNVVSLKSKATGELLWRFGPAGEVVFACPIPGHMEAGMKGDITVK